MTARTTVTDPGSDADAARTSGASDAVIQAVAEAKGVDPLELDPLYDRIDLDAVDRLFASADVPAGRLSFEVAGCRVRVRADGQVSATPLGTADGVGQE
ncbi:HalOD1 output domain-containing protein [Natronoarchaeum rubrum]|uniref:HalOD1 output domain-containing protein n=1 Tax=Natronoarchaeum rubrum TaxID=755311 RepID=UPI0021114EAB|nr:HalOD1 output domain-containing protein [Natronoarchaeum rubrum]HMB49785.1 HalOD1 output domain-containing protein [Natronoarchaeum rubrum]